MLRVGQRGKNHAQAAGIFLADRGQHAIELGGIDIVDRIVGLEGTAAIACHLRLGGEPGAHHLAARPDVLGRRSLGPGGPGIAVAIVKHAGLLHAAREAGFQAGVQGDGALGASQGPPDAPPGQEQLAESQPGRAVAGMDAGQLFEALVALQVGQRHGVGQGAGGRLIGIDLFFGLRPMGQKGPALGLFLGPLAGRGHQVAGGRAQLGREIGVDAQVEAQGALGRVTALFGAPLAKVYLGQLGPRRRVTGIPLDHLDQSPKLALRVVGHDLGQLGLDGIEWFQSLGIHTQTGATRRCAGMRGARIVLSVVASHLHLLQTPCHEPGTIS